jgi:hypothetical protein
VRRELAGVAVALVAALGDLAADGILDAAAGLTSL